MLLVILRGRICKDVAGDGVDDGFEMSFGFVAFGLALGGLDATVDGFEGTGWTGRSRSRWEPDNVEFVERDLRVLEIRLDPRFERRPHRTSDKSSLPPHPMPDQPKSNRSLCR